MLFVYTLHDTLYNLQYPHSTFSWPLLKILVMPCTMLMLVWYTLPVICCTACSCSLVNLTGISDMITGPLVPTLSSAARWGWSYQVSKPGWIYFWLPPTRLMCYHLFSVFFFSLSVSFLLFLHVYASCSSTTHEHTCTHAAIKMYRIYWQENSKICFSHSTPGDLAARCVYITSRPSLSQSLRAFLSVVLVIPSHGGRPFHPNRWSLSGVCLHYGHGSPPHSGWRPRTPFLICPVVPCLVRFPDVDTGWPAGESAEGACKIMLKPSYPTLTFPHLPPAVPLSIQWRTPQPSAPSPLSAAGNPSPSCCGEAPKCRHGPIPIYCQIHE